MDPVRNQEALSHELAIDWGVVQIPYPAQSVSGDRHLVNAYSDGLLIAVVDGLGHGKAAYAAAELAVTTLKSHSSEPVIPLLKRCHDALKETRGAAISLASFSAAHSSMTWLGVGNVEGVVLRADRNTAPAQEHIMLYPGTVGDQIPALRATVTPMRSGDLVIFFTDGIRRDFLLEPIPMQSPQLIARRISDTCSKGTDDALVLVARYL
jgi:hypothetical protein